MAIDDNAPMDDDMGDVNQKMAGGPTGYYNPAFGVMAIQQPEMFVQHLASKGVAPPPDFPDDFDHHDAHEVLGRSLKTADAGGESFDNRFNAFSANQKSQLPSSARSYFDPLQGENYLPPPPAPSEKPVINPPKAAAPPPAAPPAAPVRKKLDLGRPSDDAPREFYRDVEPLPPSDAPAAGGGEPRAAGKTSSVTGGLNTHDATTTAEAEKQSDQAAGKKPSKDDGIDSFGKALAGISSIKTPPPVFPHPGNIPHPGTQITRSTLPTEILKELSAVGHPTNAVRLGAVLKGR